MILVISDKISLSGSSVIVAPSIRGISEFVGDIPHLVLNSFNEDLGTTTKEVSKFRERFPDAKIWYIVSEGVSVGGLEVLVTGFEGNIVLNEGYLESEETLLMLLNGEISVPALYGSDTKVSDTLLNFSKMFLEGNEEVPIPVGYQNMMKNAIVAVSNEVANKSEQLVVLANTAKEVFENQSESLEIILDERQKLQETIEGLEQAIDSMPKATAGRGGALFYPKVDYRNERDIIRFKDFGKIPYFTSFVMGLREYLDRTENKRTKLVFIEPPSNVRQFKYASYPWITKERENDFSLYDRDVVFTNHPTNLVISRLMDSSAYDTYIFVDRTETTSEHILNSRRDPRNYYGIRGVSEKQLVKVVGAKFFNSIVPVKGEVSFTVPFFRDYPSDSFDRVGIYLKYCSPYYKKIYTGGI